MMAEAMAAFIPEMTKRTNSNEMHWFELSELVVNEPGFPDLISQGCEQLFTNEFKMPLINNSFYCNHAQGIVALLRLRNYSGRDGSQHDSFALLMQIRKNAPVYTYENDYFEKDFSVLHMAILDQINRDIELPNDLYEFMHSW